MTRKEDRRQLLLRYNKERQRNVLAKPGAHEFVLVLDQLKPSYNVGKTFRSAEAFGAAAVHLVNIAPFEVEYSHGTERDRLCACGRPIGVCRDAAHGRNSTGDACRGPGPDSRVSMYDVE